MSATRDLADLARRFDADRRHLRSVAYQLLGSVADADDAVQSAWLKACRSDFRSVDKLPGIAIAPEGRAQTLLRIAFADDDRIQTIDITADTRRVELALAHAPAVVVGWGVAVRDELILRQITGPSGTKDPSGSRDADGGGFTGAGPGSGAPCSTSRSGGGACCGEPRRSPRRPSRPGPPA